MRAQDMAKGALGTVREGVRRAQDDLGANEYRDIDERHRKQQIEMRTTEKAASDLDYYHKVQTCPSAKGDQQNSLYLLPCFPAHPQSCPVLRLLLVYFLPLWCVPR